jgi:hypothetical protein
MGAPTEQGPQGVPSYFVDGPKDGEWELLPLKDGKPPMEWRCVMPAESVHSISLVELAEEATRLPPVGSYRWVAGKHIVVPPGEKRWTEARYAWKGWL